GGGLLEQIRGKLVAGSEVGGLLEHLVGARVVRDGRRSRRDEDTAVVEATEADERLEAGLVADLREGDDALIGLRRGLRRSAVGGDGNHAGLDQSPEAEEALGQPGGGGAAEPARR